MALEEAVAAAKARAREQCVPCYLASQGQKVPDWAVHTCHGDLAAVRDVALAAVATQPHLHEYEHVNSPCDPSAVMEVSSGCPRCAVEYELTHRLPVEPKGGNTMKHVEAGSSGGEDG